MLANCFKELENLAGNRLEYVKQDLFVKDLFDGLARRYDLGNALISFGLHMKWKRAMLDYSGKLCEGCMMIDGATGTGDIAILAKSRCSGAKVAGIDFSETMLDIARIRATRLFGDSVIDFVCGDLTEQANYSRRKCDLYTIGFGLRNIFERRKAMRVIRGLMDSRGVLMILDLAKPFPWYAGLIAWFYLWIVMPIFSLFFRGRLADYLWLARSHRNYPSFSVLREELETEGFANVTRKLVGFGMIAIVRAEAGNL